MFCNIFSFECQFFSYKHHFFEFYFMKVNKNVEKSIQSVELPVFILFLKIKL